MGTLGSPAQKNVKRKCVLFKPPTQQHFVARAQAEKHRTRIEGGGYGETEHALIG